jgi:membrane-bound serine protease (ClpP class)
MNHWQMIPALVLIGAALLAVETLLPGMIAGLAGLAFLIAAVIAGYVILGPLYGSLILLGLCIGLVIGGAIWIKWFPQSAVGQKMLLRATNRDENQSDRYKKLLGRKGRTVSPCKPGGIAEIDGRRCDVTSESAFLPSGEEILVTAVEGNQVIIRSARSTNSL